MYHTVKFRLTGVQMKKLHHAHKTGSPISFNLSSHLIAPNGIPLELTETEYKKIHSGGVHRITISSSRVKRGGFLQALLPFLPTLIDMIPKAVSWITDKLSGKGLPTKYIGTAVRGRRHYNSRR